MLNLTQLLADGPVLTDGAWGTQLQQRGLMLGDSPEFWNLTHANEVEAVARSYVEAGSRIILTNTFGANRLRLESHARVDQVAELNREGVAISRRAAAGQALVFASIGPSGKLLANEEVRAYELYTAFEEQVQALAEAGADAFVVETQTDLDEAKIAVEAAHATGLPVVACMVFASGRDRDRTRTGASPEEAVEGLSAAGATVIGANCGLGIVGYLKLCQRLRAATPLPLWIKPNAGLPQKVAGRMVYRTTPAEFARHGPALIEAGANFIGGCCGTNPDYIRALGQEIRLSAR